MNRSNTAASAGAAEIIRAPTALRDKVGPRFGGVDAAAVARAEEALKGLSAQFGLWLQEELGKLEAARGAIRAGDSTPAAMDRLYLHGHDLKGLGATYGYPLISRMAGSLCKLMDGIEPRVGAPLSLIDAHIDAIRAVVRGDIRDPEHPTGRTLAQALEGRVDDYMAVANGSSTRP